MKTANLIKVSDRIVYRYYRDLYYRNVNLLKYFEKAEDFKTANKTQLCIIYDVVGSMLEKQLISVPDSERLIDITLLQQMAKVNGITAVRPVKEGK